MQYISAVVLCLRMSLKRSESCCVWEEQQMLQNPSCIICTLGEKKKEKEEMFGINLQDMYKWS